MSALLLDEPIVELWALGSLEFVLRKFVMHSFSKFFSSPARDYNNVSLIIKAWYELELLPHPGQGRGLGTWSFIYPPLPAFCDIVSKIFLCV